MPPSDRYAGKPLLRLLECYVLWSIGELPEDEETRLQAMEPQLQRALQQTGDWLDLVEKTMELPANMPDLIAESWDKNLAIAEREGIELDPQEFAEMFVDANLAG